MAAFYREVLDMSYADGRAKLMSANYRELQNFMKEAGLTATGKSDELCAAAVRFLAHFHKEPYCHLKDGRNVIDPHMVKVEELPKRMKDAKAEVEGGAA